MKKKMAIAVACLIVATAGVAAQEKKKPVPELDARVCDYMVAYQPQKDGSAEYEPGVDVHGKPVVEADLTPPVITAPEKYSFDLTVDVAEYIGLSHPAGGEGQAKIGTITVEDGRVSFNGQPLEGEAEAALRALCADRKSGITVK